MEPSLVIKPYMVEPVVHHNLDGPSSNGISSDSSQEDDWEHEFVIIFLLYFACSIKYYFIDF